MFNFDEKKATGTKNFISKFFLLFLGMLLLMSQMWPYIIYGFMWTEKTIRDFGNYSDWSLIFLGTSFVVGGVWLNTLLDLFRYIFKIEKKDPNAEEKNGEI